jgi:hypothetical protein
MSAIVASELISKIANGSKLYRGFIVETFMKFKYQIYHMKAPTRHLKKTERVNRLALICFFLTCINAMH